MTKKIILLVLTLFLAFGIAACGKDEVIDEENPVISGTRNVTYVIDQSATPNFSEGVTAFDNLDGNITSKLTVDSSEVDLTMPGSYAVNYSVTDISGNEATVTITVTVQDLSSPAIVGIQGMTYVFDDPAPNYLTGVTATDNVDGDLTADIVVDSSAVDLTVEGLYVVTYVVADAAGNSSPVYTAYLQVKQFADDADKVPPVITGQMNVSYTIGVSVAPDYLTGVMAMDNLDGDVTADLMVDSSSVDLTVPGTYIVTYSVMDEFLNEGTAQITVTVMLETEPPVISGVRILEVYQDGVPNYLLGLTVSDNVSVLTLADIVVDASAVDLTTAGRYAVIFTLTDEAGNMVTEETELIVAVRAINLEPDANATYKLSTSGTDNLNPYSETLATASTLYGWVTDGLYAGDYDWAAARDILVADGVTGLDPVIGFDEWYAGGYHAEDLPFNRYPAMADSLPVDVNGDGLVWDITLRNDLEFEDGTAIDASTFDYSWSMLLDPKLLNDRASNLYDETNIPIVNAEAYVKQLSYRTDAFGYDVYEVAGTEFTRENAYAFDDLGGNGWPMYFLDQNINLVYTGADLLPDDGIDENIAYLEDWGGGDFVVEDAYANAFMLTADDELVAPGPGWELDGVAVGTSDTLTGVAWARGFNPAYMDAAGNFATVDAEGLPVGGVRLTQEAVLWSEVGFEVISTYTFRLTLSSAKTQWDVMGNLAGGSTGVVHEAAFEAGMNAGRTSTNYGTIDNPLVSYGPFNMTAWESDVLYFYTLNTNHYSAGDFRITKLRYDVIEDQSITVDEFKAGRLDIVGVGGEYYDEFKYSLNLKLSPLTTFFRFAFNVAGSEAYALNPILTQTEFRQAFYFAIDRDTFATDVRDPSVPTFGFLGPVYYSTEYNLFSYRSSVAGNDALSVWAPNTYGYDPVQAKTLFDNAYAAAVLAGDIQDGEMVAVEYKFYDVETNWQIAEWVKDTVEAIFNAGEATDKFELTLTGVSSAALNDAWDNGDFEMTFGGWQGLNFDAPSMLGQVYNSSKAYMLEVGFDTENAVVTASLPNTKVALTGWVAAFETEFAAFLPLYDAYMLIAEPTALETSTYEAAIALVDVPTDNALAEYQDWKAVLALFVMDDLTCTYDELFTYAYGEFYNVNDVNYMGKDNDFDEITATLEAELLNQMIAIPLFTSVGTTVYSNRVVFEADSYHARMAWGGLKYIYIGTEIVE